MVDGGGGLGVNAHGTIAVLLHVDLSSIPARVGTEERVGFQWGRHFDGEGGGTCSCVRPSGSVVNINSLEESFARQV